MVCLLSLCLSLLVASVTPSLQLSSIGKQDELFDMMKDVECIGIGGLVWNGFPPPPLMTFLESVPAEIVQKKPVFSVFTGVALHR